MLFVYANSCIFVHIDWEINRIIIVLNVENHIPFWNWKITLFSEPTHDVFDRNWLALRIPAIFFTATIAVISMCAHTLARHDIILVSVSMTIFEFKERGVVLQWLFRRRCTTFVSTDGRIRFGNQNWSRIENKNSWKCPIDRRKTKSFVSISDRGI